VVVAAAVVVTERGVGVVLDESMVVVHLGLSWITSFGWFTLEGAVGLVLYRQKHVWSWRLMLGAWCF
jgi:hypothetical protein